MLACSAMVACTNTDEPEVNTGNENGGKAEAYMSVKLVMTETGGSRATDGGYNPGEDGEAEGTISEQKIDGTKSIFLFYDELGNWVTSGQLISADAFADGATGTHTGHTSDINDIKDDAYVVLSSPTDAIKKIKQVLTVVNYSKCGSLLQKTKTQALATIAAAGEDPANAGFLMSTSVYLDAAGNLVNTTAVLGDDFENADGTVTKANIQDTQEKAKANPVKIYIERASAKVQLTHGDSKTVIKEATEFEVVGSENGSNDEAGGQEGNDIVIDGIQYPAYISIDGWTINNVNTTTNLVKQLDDAWKTTVPFANWNNHNDFRSYWAMGTKYTNTDNTGLVVYNWTNAVEKMGTLVNNAMYCYEQTAATPKADKGTLKPNVTTMLIAASIKIKESATAEATSVDNIYQYGGVFYGETDYMNLLLKQIKDAGYVKAGETDGSYADLVATDLTIATDGTLAGILVTVASTGTYYKDVVETKDEKTGAITYSATSSSADAINKFLNGAAATETAAAIEGLAYVTEAQGFADGKCYYQIPIEHFDTYGVVRNHWYKLNISKVIRIGSAVYNPTVLIPQIPEQETSYYLAAEIHVLNWHVVEQDVTLD